MRSTFVILVALLIGIGGTFIFGPVLLLVGLVVLFVGLFGSRWLGRQAEAAGDVASHPGATLGAPDPKELSNQTGDADAARQARDRSGTT